MDDVIEGAFKVALLFGVGGVYVAHNLAHDWALNLKKGRNSMWSSGLSHWCNKGVPDERRNRGSSERLGVAS